MNRILGIDPGRLMGWAILEQDELGIRLDASGVREAPRKHDSYDEILAWQLRELSDLATYVDVLVLESGYVGRNPKVAIKLAELRGAIKAFCLGVRLDCTCFDPSEVKKAATGKGNADKATVARYLPTLGIVGLDSVEGRGEDETDAIAIAYAYAAACRDAAQHAENKGRIGLTVSDVAAAIATMLVPRRTRKPAAK